MDSSPQKSFEVQQGRLAILGSFPPPIGGVTIHLRRLAVQLEKLGVQFTLFNLNSDSEQGPHVVSITRSRIWSCLKILMGRKFSSILIANRRIWFWGFVLMITTLFRKRVVIRLQGSDIVGLSQKGGMKWWFVRRLLGYANGVVCVNDDLADALAESGIPRKKLAVIPGYLPPCEDEYDDSTLPKHVQDFCKSHQPLLSANGKFETHKGQDLYGFDMVVDLVEKMKPGHPQLGCIIGLAHCDENSKTQLAEMKKLAEDKGVSDNICWLEPPNFFVPILSQSDVFLRPTNTEGDSNSLREALDLGVPSVASDVAPRPDPSLLFRNRDGGDMYDQTQKALLKERSSLSSDREAEFSERIQKYVTFLME